MSDESDTDDTGAKPEVDPNEGDVHNERTAPLISAEEAGILQAIARDPLDTVARMTHLDWLTDRAECGDESANRRLELIRVMTLTEPYCVRQWEPTPTHDKSYMNGRWFTEDSQMVVASDASNRTLEELCRRELELLEPYGNRIRRVTCLLCEGKGEVLMEKEEPPSLFGRKRLIAEPEYEVVRCPRCHGMKDEGGLWVRMASGRSPRSLRRREANQFLDVKPRVELCRGYISDVWSNPSDLWDHVLNRPADWIVRSCLWHPIERINSWSGTQITLDTGTFELAERNGWFLPDRVKPMNFLAWCRELAQEIASEGME